MISQRSVGEVAIVKPSFREETVHDDAAGLAALVVKLTAAGNRHLVVDLSDVKRCDDDVAGVVGKVRAHYEKLGGRVVLTTLSSGLRNLLHLCRLDQVIEVYETEAEAIASFGERWPGIPDGMRDASAD